MTTTTTKYDTLLIDTSIFDENGLRLEKGVLGKLSQFRKSPITLLMPDVILNEINAHLEKKIKEVKGSLQKSFKNAEDYLTGDVLVLKNAKKLLVEDIDIKELAETKLKNFITETGALLIQSGDYVSIESLLRNYFSNSPPFAETGKKKNEFPDAITLYAVEEWANKENKTVLAIAQDNDWKEYCEKSNRIDYLDNLSSGLMIFNQENAPYAFLDNLEKALNSNATTSFADEIESLLTSTLDEFIPDQEAESSFYWEAEGCHGWFKEFFFKDHDFRIIDVDEEWIVIAVWVNIKVGAKGEFSFSVYDSIDRDNVPMGGITIDTEEDFDSELLITVSGDLTGRIEDLTVEEVEIIHPISSIDFGNIEPDFGDDHY